MPQITINNKYIASSINNNLKFIFFGLILIIYFGWMDIALFFHLQRWSPPPIDKPISTINSSSTSNYIEKKYNNIDPFTVFKPLSVKLIMVDHVTHYIHDILARFVEDTLHFTSIFPWVTANLVSFTGLTLAFIGSRLILSDKILYNRIGALLFELRNLADSLDGVVFRSRLRQADLKFSSVDGDSTIPPQVGVYQSYHSSSGYKVDAICDGLGGLFFVLAIFIKFLRHLPQKNRTPKLIIAKFKSDNNRSNSTYKYQKLNEDDEFNGKNKSSHQSLQMELISDGDIQNNQNNDENSSDNSDNNEPIIINPNANIIAASVFAASNDAHINDNQNNNVRHLSSRQVKLIVISFGLRLLFTGLIWDHFVHKYHDLLMNFSDNPNIRRMQGQSFKSIGMWLIMWFWRLGNACSILEHLTITTFFNKLWEYVFFTTYIGWAYLIILSLITQIHYTELYDSINSYATVN